MTDNQIIVEALGLTKIYGSNGEELRALDNVSFQIHQAEFVAVMGPSGCGKSTLLNLIGALDRPTAGQVIIDGHDLARQRDLDSFRAQTVGFVFQMHNLIPTLTALENVIVPMQGQGGSARAHRARAGELLAMVGMSERGHHLPAQLSGGQRQKVAIARALANRPAILLADEPTGNLDSVSGDEVLSVFEALHSEHGTTILIVTHDPRVARRTHRILLMKDGKIIHEDIVGDVYTEDLKVLARSDLGQAVLSGLPITALDDADRAVLQKVLERIAHENGMSPAAQ
jgi:ABC-type lipoprotein export system ATPase subunit